MEHSRPIQPSDENPKNGTRLKSNKMSTSYMVDGGGGGSGGEIIFGSAINQTAN